MLKLFTALFLGLLTLTIFLGYLTHPLEKKHPKVWLAIFLGMIIFNNWVVASFLELSSLLAWICLGLATIDFVLAFMLGDVRATLSRR